MEPWLLGGAALVLVAFGGLLAAVDSAITSTSRGDIVDLAEHARARRALLAIAHDTGPHLNALNFLRITAEMAAAVLVTLAFASVLDNVWLVLLFAALLMSAVSFVLVGVSPRSVGRAHAGAILKLTAPLVRSSRVLLGPLADGLVWLGNVVTPGRTRLGGVDSEEQLLSMVDEAAEHAVLEEDDRELIHSIFEFNETVVRAIMIPRTDMITIEADAHLTQAMGLFHSTGVSRIPVIRDDVDDVVGVLYLRDLSRLGFERPLDADELEIAEIARPAAFVPESMKADALLRQMQVESNHLAMIVDEYGGIAGLVTMEDLIEELVGDISDEYDREVVEVEELGDGRFRVSARLPVDEFGDLFGIELDDEDVDSVGGLFAKVLGRLPVLGEQASLSGLIMVADRTEGRRKRLSTVIAWRDQALIDAQSAFEGADDERRNGRG